MSNIKQFFLLDRQQFTDCFGELYEHSPWIAERAYDLVHNDAAPEEVPGLELLNRHFETVVQIASREEQLGLLNAHPELACVAAGQSRLTVDSKSEQFRAGLSQCTGLEFKEFKQLNLAYRTRFGFPFILAVRGYQREEILKIFRHRIENEAEDEFGEALMQVGRIGRFRLEAMFDG